MGLSKIVFIGTCLYFIINYDKFIFTFKVPAAVRLIPFIDYSLKIIKSIRVLFICIALCIVILTFLHPRNPLQLWANFLSGNIFSLSYILHFYAFQEYLRRIFY